MLFRMTVMLVEVSVKGDDRDLFIITITFTFFSCLLKISRFSETVHEFLVFLSPFLLYLPP